MDQERIVAFLASVVGGRADVIRTHISVVVVGDARAFKLKRAVRLPYLDFTTPALRLAACEVELMLNRRTAPRLYRLVHRIVLGPDGSLDFDGPGELLDAVVEMERFPQSALLDRMAGAGSLTREMMTDLAGTVAAFHRHAAVDARAQGAAAIARIIDGNVRSFALTSFLPGAAAERVTAACRESLARHTACLDARTARGKVRRCHGDLHLGNICLIEGRPVLFDCLEFSEELATIDVLYDLAFLLMDLRHRGLAGHANLVFNRYLDAADETDGLAVLPLFMALRAAIRAHVLAARADGLAGAERDATAAQACSYLAEAENLLAGQQGALVAVGGLSGSGKSTLAASIAPFLGPPPGARILASDRLRKVRFGVAATVRLPAEAYRPDVSAQVYATLCEQAKATLETGHGVVADAVFDRPEDRQRIEAAARDACRPFAGFWLEAAEDVLVARVEARRGDPSDATADVVRRQYARAETAIAWQRVDAGAGLDVTMATVRAALEPLAVAAAGATEL